MTGKHRDHVARRITDRPAHVAQIDPNLPVANGCSSVWTFARLHCLRQGPQGILAQRVTNRSAGGGESR